MVDWYELLSNSSSIYIIIIGLAVAMIFMFLIYSGSYEPGGGYWYVFFKRILERK